MEVSTLKKNICDLDNFSRGQCQLILTQQNIILEKLERLEKLHQHANFSPPSPELHHQTEIDSLNFTEDQLPDPLPIVFTKEELQLSQQEQQQLKINLKDPQTVIKNSNHLCTEKTISRLALKLAHKSYFGQKILFKCTVMGEQGLPGLPRAELSSLKTVLFQQLPKYWKEKNQFESVWNTCVAAINGACRRERYKINPQY